MTDVQVQYSPVPCHENKRSDHTANKNEAMNRLGGKSSSVVLNVNAANDMNANQKATWFERNLTSIGACGSIDNDLFIKAVREIEGFAENLFNIFDTNEQDLVSVQELVGGFGLLIEDKNHKSGQALVQWFNEHLQQLGGEESFVSREQFVDEMNNDVFVTQLFKTFDLDGNGEIQVHEFISSLDRLECASVDSKWYRWIEHHFHVDQSVKRKITFEQFKKTLHLKQSFFAERFFTMFDKDGDGSIDMKELVNGLQLLTNGTEKKKLKFLFDVYDIDGNGSLNMDEMKVVLQSCVKESHIMFSDDQMQELVEVFFDEIDADLNGKISFDEFATCLSKFPGVAENLTITAANWLNPSSEKSKRNFKNRAISRMQWSYIRKNKIKVFFVFLYFLVNVALITWVAIERRNEGGWVILARVHGMCLNFNSVFVLVLMLKYCLTWLRATSVGKYFPIDNHIDFHKAVAVVIFIQAVLHFVGHLGRYIVTESDFEVWEYLFTTRAGEGWINGTAGITGVLLFVIFGVMAVMSLPFVRRNGYFELFYFTHHMYLVWWTLLILHAPNFWKWFVGPACIYLIERILRLSVVNKARYGKTYIKEGIIFPSNVTQLIIPRAQNFKYKAGDYVLVNIPHIAKYEWHPFTISSSPDQTETIWLHIRAVGTWTKKLYHYYYEESKTKSTFTRKSLRKTIKRVMDEERNSQNYLRRRSLYSPTSQESLKGNGNESEVVKNVSPTSNKGSYAEDNVFMTDKSSIAMTSYKRKTISTSSLDFGIGKLEIFVDGPYGAPAEHFFEAEHAVLISSGIGVTPFASILQTLMLRYQSASHNCPNCEYSWVGNVPFSLRKLQKVDFFWINRDQAAFEWFISLLTQLELEQSEKRGVLSEHFLDMHIYMTSALKKEDMKALGLQLALELIHQKKEKDLITGLRTRTRPGRPDWNQVFKELRNKDYGKVSVFYCGNPALGDILKQHCQKHQFEFRSEKF